MSDAVTEIRRLIAADRFGDALQACDRLLSDRPDDLEAVLLKAWLLSSPVPEVSAPEAAVALLQQQVARSPELYRLHLALGQAYDSGLGHYLLAAREYREALRLQPASAEASLGLVLLVDAPGSGVGAEEAVQHAIRAAEHNPTDPQLWREGGLLLWRLGRLTEAKTAFRRALGQLTSDEASGIQVTRWLSQIDAGVTYRDRPT